MSRIYRETKGFTIIEVVIVLALAAFIFTIVFFAVPQLQNSLRNNQRERDVDRTVAAILEFKATNDGRLPSSQADVISTLRIIGTPGFNDTEGRPYYMYYRPSPSYRGTHTGNHANNNGRDIIIIHPDAQCTDSGSFAEAAPGKMAVKLHAEGSRLVPRRFICKDI